MGSRVEEIMRELAAAIREEVGALPTSLADLGTEVERARLAARLSLQEVADAAGLTKSHVWEIAKGRSRNPTVAAMAGLSKALGVPFLRLAQAALNSRTQAGLPNSGEGGGNETL
jgi:transcriptional regulator with XRE-family HTH domain